MRGRRAVGWAVKKLEKAKIAPIAAVSDGPEKGVSRTTNQVVYGVSLFYGISLFLAVAMGQCNHAFAATLGNMNILEAVLVMNLLLALLSLGVVLVACVLRSRYGSRAAEPS